MHALAFSRHLWLVLLPVSSGHCQHVYRYVTLEGCTCRSKVGLLVVNVSIGPCAMRESDSFEMKERDRSWDIMGGGGGGGGGGAGFFFGCQGVWHVLVWQ